MSFSCGIIGLPNVGKSTLFNALTNACVKTANFPFCTINPNIGVIPIPDVRIHQIASIVKPLRIVPATIEFIDIAGLVEGASKGKGLGNKFLNNISHADAIGHVVRCFHDESIIHTTNNIDPVQDIKIIDTELILFDIERCERSICNERNCSRTNNINFKYKSLILEKCLSHLYDNHMLHTLGLGTDEKDAISYLNLLTLKPMMYIANINRDIGYINNHYLNIIQKVANLKNLKVVVACAKKELDIIKLQCKDKYQYSTVFRSKKSCLDNIIISSYKMLNLQTFFTMNGKEIRAWLIRTGTTALQAAGKIHTDLQKGFIRTQVITLNDFLMYKGEKGVKQAGKIHYEGKNYLINDGDILKVLFKS